MFPFNSATTILFLRVDTAKRQSYLSSETDTAGQNSFRLFVLTKTLETVSGTGCPEVTLPTSSCCQRLCQAR